MTDLQEAREELSDLLWAIPEMQEKETRDSIIAELHRRARGVTIPAQGTGKILCIGIIDAFRRETGGLQVVAKTLVWITDDSSPAVAFSDRVDELLPTESLTLETWIGYIAGLDPLVRSGDLASYFRGVANDIPSRGFADLEDLARELVQLDRQGPGRVLIELSEAISRRAGNTRDAAKAREWSDRLARFLGEDLERFLAEFRASGKLLASADHDRSTIVLKLDTSGARHDHYLFSAWLYLDNTLIDKIHGDDNPVDLDRVHPILCHLIDQVSARVQNETGTAPEMALEFILPRTMLSYPFEQWRNRERTYLTLGVQFIVVVRDLETIRDPLVRGRCANKWKYMFREGNGLEGGPSVWVTCADNHRPEEVFFRMKRDGHGSLGLTFQPGDGVHTFDLDGALEAGTPIVIWPRGCEHAQGTAPAIDGTPFRDDLLGRLSGRSLSDLPRVVFDMRNEQAESGLADVGVTLLWNDPARIPEPAGYRMAMPGRREDTP
jgi:vWA-MoxR associated protein C-terminal domain